MLTYPLTIGWPEILIIVAVVLLLFGGRKIPELMRGIGKGVSSFKKGLKEGSEPEEQKQSEDGKTSGTKAE